MLDSYKPGVSRLSQRGASAPSLTSQFYKYRYAAAFSAAPQFQALHLCTIIGSGQTPAASRAKNPAIFYQCFQGDFLIFCCLAQKSCPPCFSGTPCLRRKFQMAEKYTEPLWRAGAAFSATPGDGGVATANGHSLRPGHHEPAAPDCPLYHVRRRIDIAGCPPNRDTRP